MSRRDPAPRLHLRPLLTTLLLTLALAACTATAGAAPGHAIRGLRAAHGLCRTAHHGKRHPRRCEEHPARHASTHIGRKAHRHHKRKPRLHPAPNAAAPRRTPASAAAPQAQSSTSTAAVLAGVLATPCQNTELTPTGQDIDAIDAATLCLVNQVRARGGELPLRDNGELGAAATEHSVEMVNDDYFAHIAPSGLTPLERVRESGYVPNDQVGYTVGENIAWGTLQLSTPAAVVASWVASPEHLKNILDSDYKDTAIGVAPSAPPSMANGQAGAVYTQEFGVIVY